MSWASAIREPQTWKYTIQESTGRVHSQGIENVPPAMTYNAATAEE